MTAALRSWYLKRRSSIEARTLPLLGCGREENILGTLYDCAREYHGVRLARMASVVRRLADSRIEAAFSGAFHPLSCFYLYFIYAFAISHSTFAAVHSTQVIFFVLACFNFHSLNILVIAMSSTHLGKNVETHQTNHDFPPSQIVSRFIRPST